MYIITPNAEQISRTAWQDLQQRPSADGKPNVTTHWWGMITHPVSPVTALVVDEEEAFTLKPDAVGDNLMPLLEIPAQEEKNRGKQDILDNRSNRIQVKNLLPTSIIDAAKTREEMEADGWFTE